MQQSLRSFRIASKLSQAQLAKKLGISKSMLSMIESRERQLPAAALNKLNQLPHPKVETSEEMEKEPELPISYNSIQQMHRRHSANYLASYKEDLQLRLLTLQKRWKSWTNKYQQAVANLVVAEHILQSLEHTQTSSPQWEEAVKKRMQALDILVSLVEAKPEIIHIKIAGVKQELRSLKALLSNKIKPVM